MDSHLHLEPRESRQALDFAEATETLLLACGVDRPSSAVALKLASESNAVRAFVGIHPSEAVKAKDTSWLRREVARAAGVGEIGLDPKYSSVGSRGAQMRVFLEEVGLAEKARKPLQIHSRGAERACLDLLEGFGLRSVLMHWFQEEGELRRVMDHGFYVSLGPSLLYSKRLQRIARSADRGLVLTETDSPVSYDPLGGVHGPSLVPSVVFRLAELWGIPFDETRETVGGNAMRFLGAAEKG